MPKGRRRCKTAGSGHLRLGRQAVTRHELGASCRADITPHPLPGRWRTGRRWARLEAVATGPQRWATSSVTRRRCCPSSRPSSTGARCPAMSTYIVGTQTPLEPTQDIDGTLVDSGQQHGHRAVPTQVRSESFRGLPGPAGRAENRYIEPSSKIVKYEGDRHGCEQPNRNARSRTSGDCQSNRRCTSSG